MILPAIVALVASNFSRAERPRAYGLVASAGAIAVAAGPLIGGLFTTYLSWRLVFAGEVVLVLVILLLTRGMAEGAPGVHARLDLVGTALSALGLGLVVFAILRAGAWGFVLAKPGAPEWLGLSPVIWLVLGGGVVLWLFIVWESRRLAHGAEPLVNPAMFGNPTLRAGLTSFFFQYLLQAGLFFTVPLFLSVALGLSAIATGHSPAAAVVDAPARGRGRPQAVPRRLAAPDRPPRVPRAVRRDRGHDRRAPSRRRAEIVTWPMLLAGLRRRPRLAARNRDRVIGSRRAERRRRRAPEHGDEPRRVDRHRARRRRPDRRPDDLGDGGHREQSRRAR